MKSPFRHLFLGAFLASCLAGTFAQEAPKADQKSVPPAEAVTPAGAEVPSAPAAAPAAPAEAALAAVEAEKQTPDAPPLRRIDETSENRGTPEVRRSRYSSSNQFPLGDHTIPKGSGTREVVSIMGSSTIDGETDYDAVSIGGDTTVGPDAKVGGAAVAILGRVSVKGQVRREAVSVLGGVYIDGHVRQEVVSVLGDLQLGPNAVVDGDIVLVGGRFAKDPKAIVHGNQVNVPIFGHVGGVEWLVTWLKRCAMFGRMLSFDHQLAWAWGVALIFLLFYVVLALLFRRGIDRCVQTLTTRPGSSILASIFAVLLIPIAIVLLCVSVVGIPVVPFFFVAVLCAVLFGKAVMLAWIGRPFTRFFGDGPLGHTAVAVMFGGLVVLLLYTVPVLGILLFKLFGWLGLGVVVYTVMLSSKREKPAAPPKPMAPMAPRPVAPVNPVVTPVPFAATGGATVGGEWHAPASPGGESAGAAAMPPPSAYTPPPVYTPSPVVSAATLPRAGFWLRLGAMLLDLVLMGVIAAFVGEWLPRDLRIHNPPGILPWLALYGAVMWKLKGTTIGGVVCGLKVVRVDGRELDWATAIVRALGCFLSLVVAGLGFLWVTIDDQKQSWHDKIAGTTVVRVPKGTPLV